MLGCIIVDERPPDYHLGRLVKEIEDDIEVLWSEMGYEALDGLYSMYEGSEDITCMSVKRLRGKRDKRYGKVNIFKGGEVVG